MDKKRLRSTAFVQNSKFTMVHFPNVQRNPNRITPRLRFENWINHICGYLSRNLNSLELFSSVSPGTAFPRSSGKKKSLQRRKRGEEGVWKLPGIRGTVKRMRGTNAFIRSVTIRGAVSAKGVEVSNSSREPSERVKTQSRSLGNRFLWERCYGSR